MTDTLSPGARECIKAGIDLLNARGPAGQQSARYIQHALDLLDGLARQAHAQRWRQCSEEMPPPGIQVSVFLPGRMMSADTATVDDGVNWRNFNWHCDLPIAQGDWWQPYTMPPITLPPAAKPDTQQESE